MLSLLLLKNGSQRHLKDGRGFKGLQSTGSASWQINNGNRKCEAAGDIIYSQEHDAASHTESTGKKEKVRTNPVYLAFSLMLSCPPVHGVLRTFRMALPTSVNLMEKILHRHTQMFVSRVILDPSK